MYFLLDFYWQILTNTSMLLLVEWKSTEKQDLLRNVRMSVQATESLVFKKTVYLICTNLCSSAPSCLYAVQQFKVIIKNFMLTSWCKG